MGGGLGVDMIIREHRRAELRHLAERSNQVVLFAALTGVITGFLVAGFEWLVVEVAFDSTTELPVPALAVAPLVGLLLAGVARRYVSGPGTNSATADEYLHAFHDSGHRLGVRATVGRLVASVCTLGSGNPMGLEGPSLYAGATIGASLQRRLPRVFRNAEHRVLLVAGAAAGVAAIFKAPATGAVFAMEVPYRDDLARHMLLPALVSSASAYLAFAIVHGTGALIPIDGTVPFAIRDLAGAVMLGIAAGFVARVFAKLIRHAKQMAASPRSLVTTVVAGTVVGLLFLAGRALTGESLVLGSGYSVVEWVQEPDRAIGVLVVLLGLRCLGTAATVAGGGVGGLFVPLVAAGAITGSIIGRAVDHRDLSLFIVVGIAAFLGAGYRVPLAAVTFVAETTGRPSFIVPGLLAAVAAELVMGPASVTAYQRAFGTATPVAPAPG